MTILLRNPHSVLAVFEARPGDVLEVRVPGTRPGGAWGDVIERAAQYSVPVRAVVPQPERERRRSPKPVEKEGRTGVAEASVRGRADIPPGELFAGAAERAEGRGLWLALDQIQDPHNVGAIFRTAAFFGVQGMVVTRDRSAPLNGTVYDVASGGVEHVPFAAPPNLARALEMAKEAGLWVLGSSEHATKSVGEIDRERPWLLVLGNEEKGLRRLTLETCDEVCRLTPRTAVTSLNVSVAAGVLIAALTSSV